MISNKMKRLINECACYDYKAHGIQNYCCHEPGELKQCVYYMEDKTQCCRYFEEAVLPLDPETAAIYHAERQASANGYQLTNYQRRLAVEAIKIEVRCVECGKVFNPASRRQKLCDYCRNQRIREQARIRKRKQRKGA